MNGHKKNTSSSSHWDVEDSQDCWWENTIRLAVQPLHCPGLETPEEQHGVFWEALNKGVASQVQQTVKRLFVAFLSLSELEARVFVMRTCANKSFRDIGLDLKITHRTASKVYARAEAHIQSSIQRIHQETAEFHENPSRRPRERYPSQGR